MAFWETGNAVKCNKYINHLCKVLPKLPNKMAVLLAIRFMYAHVSERW